jgi:hypothetical protein
MRPSGLEVAAGATLSPGDVLIVVPQVLQELADEALGVWQFGHFIWFPQDGCPQSKLLRELCWDENLRAGYSRSSECAWFV